MKIVNRIRKNEDFVLTIRKGKALGNSDYTIHVNNNNLNHVRVGISVSSKLGNAVIRSRIKRQIRAIIDNLIDFNQFSLDIVIVARKGFLNNDFNTNKISLMSLLKTYTEKK